MKRFLSLLLSVSLSTVISWADDVDIVYQFDTTSDVSGNYTGTLHSGATLVPYSNIHVLDLGTENGYFELDPAVGEIIGGMGENYLIAATVFIPEDADLTQNGNFVWCFAKSSGEGYQFLSAKDVRFAISQTDYTGESSVTSKSELVRGQWNSIIYVQRRTTGVLYINGTATSGSISLLPSAIGATSQNYLGRSCYEGDSYLKGCQIAEFRIHNYRYGNLSSLQQLAKDLNVYADSVALRKRMQEYNPGDWTALKTDIELPTRYGDFRITWATTNPNVITDRGHITRPAAGYPIATASLIATLKIDYNGESLVEVLEFPVGVLPEISDEESVALDVANITFTDGHLNNLYTNITLPTVGAEGSTIFWESSDTEWVTNEGRVLRQPEAGAEKHHLTMTATVMKGQVKETRQFDTYIHPKENYKSYLFVYFPSNADENLYYALSTDGYNYTPINKGKPFFKADTTTVMGGLRDPHILRGNDGWFYMVNTDMKCSLGWESNRGIVLSRSRDLVHWTHSTVHFPTRFERTTFANVDRVWAPETIYDPDAGKYMVYFSIRTTDGTAPFDKDYYCYANEDFTDLEGLPEYFYDRGSATIDMDIVYNESDGLYHGFYKNEGEGGICKVTAKRLTAEPGQPAGSQWSEPTRTLQQTTEAVEGAGVFKLINRDSWILMYDCYNAKHYQFCSSPDLSTFTFVQNTATSGAFTPRHGTVLPITAEEEATLLAALPMSGVTPSIVGSENNHTKTSNVEVSSNNIYMPVEPGVDITSFDPCLVPALGCTITPTGAQDFSAGPVAYTVSSGDNKVVYQLSVAVEGNPVIPDYHADPEVLFSKKTGRFYVYPTTDGYSGWGGYTFDVFSSPDLLHFSNEGTILNLQINKDVAWASGNAWAPCIEEKWVEGKWRYYFFFSGNNRNLSKKTLGVAVAESPTGPFRALGTPLFTSSAAGQMIDSDVFTDPVSGQTYLYYGNGQMCYRLMNDDMMSVGGTEYVITPTGGTNDDYRYREGTYVFYRNGIYYFLWSVDDTGATNYHVAYGTSTSPTGPIKVASDPIVIIQDPSKKIYGTGHNSIINVPGTDDWYIVYHRINKAYLNDGPGYHREVCVDKLTFAEDGRINRVTPTREGIEPVQVPNVQEMITGVERTPNGESVALRTDYYTIGGVSLGSQPPLKGGIYIRREVLSNGQVRSMKIVK